MVAPIGSGIAMPFAPCPRSSSPRCRKAPAGKRAVESACKPASLQGDATPQARG
jgi:hypothetical protein